MSARRLRQTSCAGPRSGSEPRAVSARCLEVTRAWIVQRIIVNGRASAISDPEGLLASLARALREGGARTDGVVTRSDEELRRALHVPADRIVLVGGDGSLHSAVNVSEELPELALVPAGRANNVARALGIPREAAAAARLAARGEARPLDVLRVETPNGACRCVEALSAGFQASARARYGEGDSGHLGAGLRALAGAVLEHREYDVDLRADGSTAFRGRAAQVFLSNLPLFGFGFRVAPRARPADGWLDAVVIRAPTRRRLLLLLATARRGRHLQAPGTTFVRAHEAELTAPLPLACDGTPLGVGTAAVRVEPARIRIVAPSLSPRS